MDAHPAYQPYLDELIAFATGASRQALLIEAKAEYFQLTGEVFEDEKAFEVRMASFLDFFLFDRPLPESGETPAQVLYGQQLHAGSTERASAFRAFTETVHGLFEIRKLGNQLVRLRELSSGKDHDVTERRQLAGLQKGDIIEARLIPFGGQLVFSSAFCFHPRAANKAILKEVKRRRKKEPQRSPKELVWECSKRALKAERYRQIAVEKLYEFEARAQ